MIGPAVATRPEGWWFPGLASALLLSPVLAVTLLSSVGGPLLLALAGGVLLPAVVAGGLTWRCRGPAWGVAASAALASVVGASTELWIFFTAG